MAATQPKGGKISIHSSGRLKTSARMTGSNRSITMKAAQRQSGSASKSAPNRNRAAPNGRDKVDKQQE